MTYPTDPRAEGRECGGFEWGDLIPGDLLFWPRGQNSGFRIVVRTAPGGDDLVEGPHRIWLLAPDVGTVWELDTLKYHAHEYILVWRAEREDDAGQGDQGA